MKLNTAILKMLSDKAGVDVTSHFGANFLKNDIEAKTGEALSLNSIKRLVGILNYDSEPRDTTLEILARYLGYDGWWKLNTAIQDKISSFNTDPGFIELKELPIGKVIHLEWNPGRKIELRHKGEGRYEVLCSHNSKLNPGDILNLSQIAVGFPLMVKDVVRNGESIGSYTAAMQEGITVINILNG